MKFVDAIANEDTRVSRVILEHKGITYCGRTVCYPNEPWSNYFGCSIAEIKAYIKFLKDEIKSKRFECKTIENFIKTIESYKTFDRTSDIAKSMYKQMNIKFKELETLLKKLELAQSKIKSSIEERDKLLLKLKEK